MKKLLIILFIIPFLSCGQVPGIGGMQFSQTQSGSEPELNTFTYDSIYIDIANPTQPYDIEFSTDGTNMYLADLNTDSVFQYSMSPAWDLESAVKTGTFKVTYEYTLTGIHFNPDGTGFYHIGIGRDRVYEYSMSTAWDITTASVVGYKIISSQSGYAYGLTLSEDGDKMYLISYSPQDYVYQYTLSTPWTITTAAYDTVSVDLKTLDGMDEINYSYDIDINSTGTKIYVCSNYTDKLYAFDLSTPFDLTTISYNGDNVSAYTPVASFVGFDLVKNGTLLYIVEFIDSGDSNIYQFSSK